MFEDVMSRSSGLHAIAAEGWSNQRASDVAGPIPLRKRRFLFISSTMAVSLLFSVAASTWGLGPRFALFITVALAASVAVYAVSARDPLIARLAVFGLVVGLGELPSDWYGVALNKTLVYPPGEPQIWASPVYMPLSWMVTMVQLGVLAAALTPRLGLVGAGVALAVLGGLNMPTYETLAHDAGWWRYRDTPMLFGVTPHYVILAEVLISAALPWMVARVARARGRALVGLGLAQAAWILAAGVFAFWLVG